MLGLVPEISVSPISGIGLSIREMLGITGSVTTGLQSKGWLPVCRLTKTASGRKYKSTFLIAVLLGIERAAHESRGSFAMNLGCVHMSWALSSALETVSCRLSCMSSGLPRLIISSQRWSLPRMRHWKMCCIMVTWATIWLSFFSVLHHKKESLMYLFYYTCSLGIQCSWVDPNSPHKVSIHKGYCFRS